MFELLLQADKSLSEGLLDQAERTYWQLIELDPTNAIAMAGLAMISLERQDKRLARTFAERALSIDPDSIVARRVLQALDEGATLAPEPAVPDAAMRGAEKLEALSRRRTSQVDGDDGSATESTSREKGPTPRRAAQSAQPQAPAAEKAGRGGARPGEFEGPASEPLRERRKAGRLAAAAAAAAAAAGEPRTHHEPHHAMPAGPRQFEPTKIRAAQDPFAAAEMAAAVAAVDSMDEEVETEAWSEPAAAEVEAEPIVAEVAADVAAEPVAAEPVAAEPTAAEPAAEAIDEGVVAESVAAEVIAEPVVAEVVNELAAEVVDEVAAEVVDEVAAVAVAAEPAAAVAAEPAAAEVSVAGKPADARAAIEWPANDRLVSSKPPRATARTESGDLDALRRALLAEASPEAPELEETTAQAEVGEEPPANADAQAEVGEEPPANAGPAADISAVSPTEPVPDLTAAVSPAPSPSPAATPPDTGEAEAKAKVAALQEVTTAAAQPQGDDWDLSEANAEREALREAVAIVMDEDDGGDAPSGQPGNAVAVATEPASTEPETPPAEVPADASVPSDAPATQDSAPRKKGLFRRIRG